MARSAKVTSANAALLEKPEHLVLPYWAIGRGIYLCFEKAVRIEWGRGSKGKEITPMADRRVTHSRKDRDGDITALCNPGESWSPPAKADAIRDIDNNIHTYHVLAGGRRVGIHVVNGPTGKYLRTDPDLTDRNNLDDLPNC